MKTARDLAKKYYEELPTPTSHWSGPKFFLAVTGCIGSGKSTVLRELSQRLGLYRIESDQIRLLMDREDVDSATREQLLFDIINETAELIFTKGHSIAFDMNGGSESAKAAVKEREQQYGVKSVWLDFDISEPEIRRRLESRTQKIHQDSDHAYQNYLEQQKNGQDYFTPLHEAVYTFTDGELEPQLNTAEENIHAVFAEQV